MVFAAFVIVGCVNAVNITDGVDGLAASVTLPVAVFYVAVSLTWGTLFTPFGQLAAALAGGLVAFLFYNFHPAKVFMGDTGSLYLGGILMGLGFMLRQPVVMILICGVFVLDMLSSFAQILSYKLFKKRIFKMAPVHHHFEKMGWSEVKIVYVFAALGLVFGVAGVLLAVF
jgi:phospho-N-acetylmuramoyl-pentapeptide-transferase